MKRATLKSNGKKGQQVLAGIMISFAAVVALMALLPTLNNQVEISAGNLTEQGADAGTPVLMRLIPFFMVLGLVSGIFVWMRSGGSG